MPSKPARKKRVFMLSSQPLFSQGMESLLSDQKGLEIVGRETDAPKAIDRIRELKPDVVVIDSKDLASVPFLVVARLLKEEQGIKIIALNLEDQTIRVYRGEQRTGLSVHDLLEVIDEEEPGLWPMDAQGWRTLAFNRAQAYGFLAAIYNGLAGERLSEGFGSRPFGFVASLGAYDHLTGDLREGMRALDQYQLAIAGKSRAEINGELGKEYADLIQSCEGEKAIGTCESAYARCDAHQPNPAKAILNERYAEGGFELSEIDRVQPDFIGCELAFMLYLCSRECVAWEKNDRDAASKVQELERAFILDHLVRWVPRFCDELLDKAKLDFYRGMAFLTKGFIFSEAYRVSELMDWECSMRDE